MDVTILNTRDVRAKVLAEQLEQLRKRLSKPPYQVELEYDKPVDRYATATIEPDPQQRTWLSGGVQLGEEKVDLYVDASAAERDEERLISVPLVVSASDDMIAVEDLVVNLIEAVATGGLGLAMGNTGEDLPCVELCRLTDAATSQYTCYVLWAGGFYSEEPPSYAFYTFSQSHPVPLDRRFVLGGFSEDSRRVFRPAQAYRKVVIPPRSSGPIAPPTVPFMNVLSTGDEWGDIYYEPSPL